MAEWACQVCSLLNKETEVVCDVCRNPRGTPGFDDRPPSPPLSPREWDGPLIEPDDEYNRAAAAGMPAPSPVQMPDVMIEIVDTPSPQPPVIDSVNSQRSDWFPLPPDTPVSVALSQPAALPLGSVPPPDDNASGGSVLPPLPAGPAPAPSLAHANAGSGIASIRAVTDNGNSSGLASIRAVDNNGNASGGIASIRAVDNGAGRNSGISSVRAPIPTAADAFAQQEPSAAAAPGVQSVRAAPRAAPSSPGSPVPQGVSSRRPSIAPLAFPASPPGADAASSPLPSAGLGSIKRLSITPLKFPASPPGDDGVASPVPAGAGSIRRVSMDPSTASGRARLSPVPPSAASFRSPTSAGSPGASGTASVRINASAPVAAGVLPSLTPVLYGSPAASSSIAPQLAPSPFPSHQSGGSAAGGIFPLASSALGSLPESPVGVGAASSLSARFPSANGAASHLGSPMAPFPAASSPGVGSVRSPGQMPGLASQQNSPRGVSITVPVTVLSPPAPTQSTAPRNVYRPEPADPRHCITPRCQFKNKMLYGPEVKECPECLQPLQTRISYDAMLETSYSAVVHSKRGKLRFDKNGMPGFTLWTRLPCSCTKGAVCSCVARKQFTKFLDAKAHAQAMSDQTAKFDVGGIVQVGTNEFELRAECQPTRHPWKGLNKDRSTHRYGLLKKESRVIPLSLSPSLLFRLVHVWKTHDIHCTGRLPAARIKAEIDRQQLAFGGEFSEAGCSSCLQSLKERADDQEHENLTRKVPYGAVHIREFLFQAALVQTWDQQQSSGSVDSAVIIGDDDETESTSCKDWCCGLHKRCLRRMRTRFLCPVWTTTFRSIEAKYGARITSYFWLARLALILNFFTICVYLMLFIPGWTNYDWYLPMSENNNGTSWAGVVVGNGMEYSWLFYGFYNATMPVGSHLLAVDIAWIFAIGAMLVIGLLGALFFNYTSKDDDPSLPFCTAVFGGYDHNISNIDSISLRSEADVRKLRSYIESVRVELSNRKVDENANDRFSKMAWRALGITLTVVLTLISGIITAFVILYEDQIVPPSSNFVTTLMSKFAVPAIISVFKTGLPYLLIPIVHRESYGRGSNYVFTNLFFRMFLIRMFFILVILFDSPLFPNNKAVDDSCANTQVGVLYYKTLWVDLFSEFLLSIPVPWLVMMGRKAWDALTLACAAANEAGGGDVEKSLQQLHSERDKKPGIFALIPEHKAEVWPYMSIELFYNLALAWSGAAFAPGIVLVSVIYTFCVVYIKKFQLLYLNRPTKVITAASTTALYSRYRMFLLLTLGISLLPFVVFLGQTADCGPHKGSKPYQVMYDWVQGGPAWIAFILDLFRNVLVLWLALLVFVSLVVFLHRKKSELADDTASLTSLICEDNATKARLIQQSTNHEADSVRGAHLFEAWLHTFHFLSEERQQLERNFRRFGFNNLLALVKLDDAELYALMSRFVLIDSSASPLAGSGSPSAGAATPPAAKPHIAKVSDALFRRFAAKLAEARQDIIRTNRII